ncbi:patatin-like phospholipase family protein [Metabacillus fastidiosus]|uniref:patatin-like phospholipase family protein n=1 Tax=Metabacillus fastidiosus TaxID=1458 RepID=UPI000825ACB2|nr:patatin-like phospholipase family protein [Metabacillus fastidiosus]MED4463824.1 patatin-like phospholipase family protein [Metabacillus fastidiosus]
MEIDGVFSGGGIKGFALIGAYKAIEKRGFQFVRLAGTSAGAIIAAFIAAGYRSEEISEMMEELDLEQFLDERKSIIPLKFMKWLLLYWRLGLYKGAKLEEWLEEKLKQKGIETFGDLPPESLRVIASDLTNGKLIVIPDDLPNYGFDSERFSVAKAVRMSCSLPYFFEPVRLAASDGANIIVDGAILSNFPIWLFYEKDKLKQKRPVLGIKLSPAAEEQPKNDIRNAIDLYGALFETMRQAHDERHIASQHEKDIVFLPVEPFLTTEFKLSNEKKLALIELGKNRTEAFLKKWTY